MIHNADELMSYMRIVHVMRTLVWANGRMIQPWSSMNHILLK